MFNREVLLAGIGLASCIVGCVILFDGVRKLVKHRRRQQATNMRPDGHPVYCDQDLPAEWDITGCILEDKCQLFWSAVIFAFGVMCILVGHFI